MVTFKTSKPQTQVTKPNRLTHASDKRYNRNL